MFDHLSPETIKKLIAITDSLINTTKWWADAYKTLTKVGLISCGAAMAANLIFGSIGAAVTKDADVSGHSSLLNDRSR